MKKIYLAGPEVFFPNSIQIGEDLKKICEENNFIGQYPLDNEIKKTSNNVKIEIVKSNILAIDKCDYIVASLSNFRGTKKHPSCDSGTAWECGYGLAKGKRVYGYTTELMAIPELMVNTLDLIVNGNFNKCLNIIKNVFSKKISYIDEKFFKEKIINIDAEYADIKDISPKQAFILGYRYGKGMPCNATITDIRSEVEKYGEKDENGNIVDDFNEPANIMIACTCNIKESSDNK